MNTQAACILAAVALLTMFLDCSQLFFVLVGIIAYALLEFQLNPKQPSRTSKTPTPAKVETSVPSRAKTSHPLVRDIFSVGKPVRDGRPTDLRKESEACDINETRSAQSRRDDITRQVTKPELRQPSSMPIPPLTLVSKAWDDEIKELVKQISSTPESDTALKELVIFVNQSVQKILPMAEVIGFCAGHVVGGKAFSVAVPEVDIVVNVSPNDLLMRWQWRPMRKDGSISKLGCQELQKTAIRACTDRLISEGGFRFRRTSFSGYEPKVTLLAPQKLGSFNECIPLDFSVNVATPLYNAAIVTECGQIEPRSKELILILRRWAKDRGICHAAKGHLPPYAWSLLTTFFLQVRKADVDEGSVSLPPLTEFHMCSDLADRAASVNPHIIPHHEHSAPVPRITEGKCTESVGKLVKEFVRFYNLEFDWKKEVVSVRSGKRTLQTSQVPQNTIRGTDNRTIIGPEIEDPFEPTRNLAANMTATSYARLLEEFVRADDLCSRGASLTELVELYTPPE